MAKLPSRFDISQPISGRSGRAIASFDTSGLARGVAQLGGAISEIGATVKRDQMAAEIVGADGPATKERHDFVRSFDQDADYGTFSQRAEKGLAAIRDKYANRITDKRVRQEWIADFDRAAEGDRNKIADLGERRVREGRLVDAKSGLQSYQSLIADNTVAEADRAKAKATAEASIGALQKEGLLTPDEADQWRENVIKGGEFVYGQREIERDPSIVTGKLSTNVSERANTAMDFFQSRGWSKEQAAGIVGNLLAESSLNTGARNAGDGRDGSDSIGIAQWNAGRAVALKQFAADHGADWRDLGVQLAFVDHELKTSHKSIGDQLRNAKDITSAAEAGIMFEGPAGSQNGPKNAHNYQGRVKFAHQAAGQAIRPDWYTAQTPENQLRLENMAAARDKEMAVAEAAQSKANASLAVDDYQLRIATSDPTLTQQQIISDDRIDNGQKATLINRFNQERDTNAGAEALIGAISAGQRVPINAFDAEQAKAAEKAYSRMVGSLGDDQRAAGTQAFITSTGYIPKAIEAQVRAGASSTDPQVVADAMGQASVLSRLTPGNFSSMPGADAISKKLDLYHTYTDTMGLTPTEAGAKIVAADDPEQIRVRDAILKSEPVKKLLKDLNADDVAAIFDKGALSAAPDVEGIAAPDEIKIGVNPQSEAAIVADYRRTMEEALIDANGDQSAAEDIAKRRFSKVYGTTNLSPLSGNIVVRYPPEKAYPALPDGSHDYIREQLVESLKNEGIEADQYYLQGDMQTEQDIKAGRPARYQVFYEKDGKLERFNLPFFADPAVANDEYHAKEDILIKDAERRMLENRVEEDRVFPEGRGFGRLERFNNGQLYRGIARADSPLGRALERARQRQEKVDAWRAQDEAKRQEFDALSPEDQRQRALDDFLNGATQ